MGHLFHRLKIRLVGSRYPVVEKPFCRSGGIGIPGTAGNLLVVDSLYLRGYVFRKMRGLDVDNLTFVADIKALITPEFERYNVVKSVSYQCCIDYLLQEMVYLRGY